jgi:hypothetical protein
LTSYALALLLVAVVVVTAAFGLGSLRHGIVLAATAVVATALWLIVVASNTVGYLSPVITDAISATVRTATREVVPRTPFRSAAGSVAPAWERVVGVTSVLIIAAAQPYGVVALWKRYRRTALAAVLTIASVAYVGAFALRLVPQAWETGARASEFLFVGGSFVVAVAAIELIDRAPRKDIARACVCSAAAVVFVGGVISATPAGFRTAQPYRAEVTGGTIEPPVLAAARWVRRELPGRSPLAAEEADGRLLLIYGDRDVVVGTFPDIRDVLQTPTLPLWQLQLLRRAHVRYIVVDTRKASADVVTGYFFASPGAVHDERFSLAVVTKFERAGASRIYDDGDVIIDDINGVSDAAATP